MKKNKTIPVRISMSFVVSKKALKIMGYKTDRDGNIIIPTYPKRRITAKDFDFSKRKKAHK